MRGGEIAQAQAADDRIWMQTSDETIPRLGVMKEEEKVHISFLAKRPTLKGFGNAKPFLTKTSGMQLLGCMSLPATFFYKSPSMSTRGLQLLGQSKALHVSVISHCTYYILLTPLQLFAHVAQMCTLSLKRALCVTAPVFKRDEFEFKKLEEWTTERRAKLKAAHSEFHVGSMQQLVQWQPLLDIFDAVCREILFCGTGTWVWLSKSLPERREMWDRYVSVLATRTQAYLDQEKRVFPVPHFADHLVGVLTWPPYEEGPPYPPFGPSVQVGLSEWAEANQPGIREVRKAI
jgi:hypothetical protein